MNPVLRRTLFAFLLFLPMATIGTQLHELGHCAAAIMMGYDVELHYGSMNHNGIDSISAIIDTIWAQHGSEIRADTTSPHLDRIAALRIERNTIDLPVTLGGPLLNMVIGTIGMFALWRLRRERREAPMNAGDWIATIAALFWARQPFILATAIPRMIAGASDAAHPLGQSDELKLAYYLNVLPPWGVSIILGVLGLAVCIWIISQLPRAPRLPTMIGGVVGSVLGFVVWYKWLGPWLLP